MHFAIMGTMKCKPSVNSVTVKREVWDWLNDFSHGVQTRNFRAAKRLFLADAMGFGTVAKVAHTLDELSEKQWSKVWPRTSGFRFRRKDSRIELSPDGLLAVVMVCWVACNQPEPIKPGRFDRRGRATLMLRRESMDEVWLGVFTHFSFDPEASRPSLPA